MRLRRLGEHVCVPWRNGLGTTLEVAVGPLIDPTDPNSWRWRVSLATVRADGPFSTFANVDRTLIVVDGEGMQLVVGRVQRSALPYHPVVFPGDESTAATLLGGPVRDLNVMVRRDFATASVEIANAADVERADIVFALGEATVGPFLLDRFDAVLGIDHHVITRGHLAIIRIDLP